MKVVIITFLFLAASSSFCMEFVKKNGCEMTEHEKNFIECWKNQQCCYCHRNIVKKNKKMRKLGALMQGYCGHSYHTFCWDEMVKSGIKKCYCSADLLQYDDKFFEEFNSKDIQQEENRTVQESFFKRLVLFSIKFPIDLFFRCSVEFEQANDYFLENRAGC